MGRENKIISNIFLNMLNNDDFDSFMNTDEKLEINQSDEIKDLLSQYEYVFNQIKPDIIQLAELEEYIIQLRCRESIKTELKFTIQREYIYARSSFVRRGYETKDMRAIVSKTEVYGSDVNLFYSNPDLIKLSIDTLYNLMTTEIKKNNVLQIV